MSIQPEYVGGSVVSEVDYRIWAHSGTRCGIERWAEDPFGEFDQAVFDEVIVVEVGGIAESDGGRRGLEGCAFGRQIESAAHVSSLLPAAAAEEPIVVSVSSGTPFKSFFESGDPGACGDLLTFAEVRTEVTGGGIVWFVAGVASAEPSGIIAADHIFASEGHIFLPVAGIHIHCVGDLFQVAHAVGRFAAFASLSECRHQHGGEDGDDCDNDEEFDQGEKVNRYRRSEGGGRGEKHVRTERQFVDRHFLNDVV